MLKLLVSLMSSSPESMSSTRFSFLLCTIISNIVVFITWAILTIGEGHFIEIPESVIMLYCLANGITFTGKIAQKSLEKKQHNNNSGEKGNAST